ncbi:Xylan 1,4-beta-xylosidase [subsurface metagenome]
MKKMNVQFLLIIIVLSICFGSADGQEYPFQNADLSIDDRVNDLVSRMTLEEKISQMQNGSGAIPRLGIPEYDWWNECLHGVARNGIATVFPQAIGMAATWNPDLIGEESDIISTEARAKYHETVLN